MAKETQQRASAEPEIKLPPQDLPMEQAALGSILVELEAAKIGLEMLREEDFYPEQHRHIFAAMRAVADRGEPVDMITVSAELRRRDRLEGAGGPQYLDALMGLVPTAAFVAVYAEGVRQKSFLRQMITFGADVVRRGYDDPPADEIPALVEKLLTGAQGFADQLRPENGECISLADLSATLRDTTWLWPGWIPRGYLTVLGGETGVGKSLTALYLSCAATGQIPWPDGTAPGVEASKVLWVDTEGRQGVTCERAAEWGVDPAAILLPGRDGLAEIDLGQPGTAAQIARQAVEHGAGLVVIDSLSGGHSLDENSAILRLFLKECGRAARDNDLAILLVHHATKRGQLQGPEMTIDRLRGSSTITQFAVAVLGLDRPDEGTKRTRLQVLKLNLGQAPDPLGFVLNGEGSFPAWGTAPRKPLVLTVDDQALTFLRDQLKDGPRLAREVWDAAETAGLSERAVNKAKGRLGIRPQQEGFHGPWWWQLPS